jgi:hypothetical protein
MKRRCRVLCSSSNQGQKFPKLIRQWLRSSGQIQTLVESKGSGSTTALSPKANAVISQRCLYTCAQLFLWLLSIRHFTVIQDQCG